MSNDTDTAANWISKVRNLQNYYIQNVYECIKYHYFKSPLHERFGDFWKVSEDFIVRLLAGKAVATIFVQINDQAANLKSQGILKPQVSRCA